MKGRRAPTPIETLADRERFHDRYCEDKDPIAGDRLLWRAQSWRHLVHLLPGQSILELGCASGRFTRQLCRVSRGENPITAVTFAAGAGRPAGLPGGVEFVHAASLPGPLAGRRFDFVVAMDLLDERSCSWLLQHVRDLLEPGGQVLFYESNPWNVMLRLHRLVKRLAGRPDPRRLLARPRLYELLSEIGFLRVFAVFNDFVYAPLTRRLVWLTRNLSILLENTPAARTLAGSILLHAQKPPRRAARPDRSLCEHPQFCDAVSVVVPCRDEAANVTALVDRLRSLYDDYLHEIVLVDDNSADGTAAAIRALAATDPRIVPVHRGPPAGVGRALADGLRRAGGRYVLTLDCDFQHLLPEVRDLFDAVARGADVAVGSRFSRHSVLLNYPLAKIVANRGFHLLAQIVLRRRFRDLTNNLELMRRDVADRLVLHEPGFAVNAETGLQPLLMGCEVTEVPISWINRAPDMGTSSFRLMRVGGGYWRVLFHLWLNLVSGRGPYRGLAAVKRGRGTRRYETLAAETERSRP